MYYFLGFYSNNYDLLKVQQNDIRRNPQQSKKRDPSLTNSQTTRNGQKNG